MGNSQALANRNSTVRKDAMHHFYHEGTGSVIVKNASDPYQAAPRLWGLLSTGGQFSREDHSATTGDWLVVTRYSIATPVTHLPMELNFEASQALVARSPAFVLDQVRTVFGLNITETAEVFGITRQTAYQWMNLADIDQVRSHENRERLKHLYSAMQLWQSQPPLKGRWLHAFLPTGETVLDLLKARQVNFQSLQAAYQALSASAANRRREEGERATRAANALASAFAGLGAVRKSRKG